MPSGGPVVNDKALREHLVSLLASRNAHIDWKGALEGWPSKLQGVKPPGAPHTAWQLLEHLRIGQWDILEFSRNPKHASPKWPDDYWPRTEAPPTKAAWEKSLKRFRTDLQALQKLVQNPKTDLLARIPHGTGQTILREALLVADHNAYHVGQLVLLRRLLGAWKSS
jgi:hypothetical protein